MAGFTLKGFCGRVPCPFCESTDCCGVSGEHLVCCSTKTKKGTPRVVSAAAIERSALKHNLPRYRVVDGGNGWDLHVYTFVSAQHETVYKVGSVALFNKEYGYRGTCPSLEAAKKFLAKHGEDLSSHCGFSR